MLTNYLKTTFRNLWKTRGYSFLNIFGLALGIAAASFIFLWVEDEINYDNLPNKENSYIVKSKQTLDGVANVSDAVPGLLGPAIKAEIPGIRHAARVAWMTSIMFCFGDNSIFQNGYYAEPDLMDIFALEFAEGDKATAMDSPDKVVLTESAATRIFGNEPVLGKMVRVDNDKSYTVSGVVKDLPKNSTLQFDWLIPFDVYEQENQWIRQWRNNVLMTYVGLEPSADVAQVNEMLYDFVIRQSSDEQLTTYNMLYPMERWRLYNSFDRDGNEQEGRMKYVRLFSIIAWVVLLIACINFMNLATARSEKRAKEVGMRKVVGATRTSLIGQFLGESIILATISALLAVGLIHLAIGVFNSLVEKELVMDLFNPTHFSFLGGIVLVCGLFSGIYPAFYLSSFNPIATLKGAKQKAGATGFIRRGLVVLQYSASITLIICTAIIFQQIQHVKGRDAGYERSQVLLTPLHGQLSAHLETIKNQLIATGAVESASVSERRILFIGTYSWNVGWEGKSPDKQVNIYNFRADADLIPSLGMEVIDGRNFRPQMLGDSASAIVNETFAKLIQPDGKVVGRTIDNAGAFTIVGVVKDFVYNNMYSVPAPLFFYPFETSPWGHLNMKIKAGADLTTAISQIEKVIKSHNPEYPFDYQFLDALFDQQFKSEALIQKLAGTFAILSIVISCLGLFGLAAFTAERRTKEMGIRKVLGASISSLVGMLTCEFVVLVLVSCAVAFPIAWWMMNDWLGSYPYRTDLHWWVFAFAGLGALLIALLTVSSQAIKAALTNPTKSLRDE
ncbi:ABC transporter permease [Parapedobacter koreensis]|uniref:Duplicated orphan permease n=1 Tax=Parapedobacter koreensis TaxID=332977 RepID=A0A1H7R3Z4_9SPHI|nr:ABC transporter permease [Parapedobacter koreensis]SEL54634.1 duplicated orphan permease [Parapedobacter koreensis]